MKNSKLFILLNTFSSSELLGFNKFLKSPYFNEDTQLSVLFNCITQLDLTNEIDISKKTLWESAFPKLPFKDSLMRLKLSNMVKLAEKFLVHQQLEQKKINLYLNAAELLNDRNLHKHQAFYHRKITTWFNDNKTLEAETIRKDFALQEINFKFIEKENNRTGQNNLGAIHKSLDRNFLLEKLKYICEAVNFTQVRNVEIDIGMSTEILKIIRTTKYLDSTPAINIYYNIYLLLEDIKNKEQLDKTQALIKQYHNHFETSEAYDLYTYLQNICIRQINSGKTPYLEALVSVYNDMMEVGIIKKLKLFTPWMYKNIITAGLLSENFDWTHQFIEEYNELLPKNEQQNAYSYNLANLHFYKKEYNHTIEILNQVKFDDVAYELDGRWLLIRSYYELKEFLSLESLLSSSRLYLLRNQLITNKTKKQYFNLIKYVKKLIKLFPQDIEKINILRTKIESQDDIVNKKWLIHQLNHLNQSRK